MWSPKNPDPARHEEKGSYQGTHSGVPRGDPMPFRFD
jgi:hypothetical protein